MDRATLAAMIDHTLLMPEATADRCTQLCAEATDLGVVAVCVSPSHLPMTGGLGVGTRSPRVIGFPSRRPPRPVKAAEAARLGPTGPTRSTWS